MRVIPSCGRGALLLLAAGLFDQIEHALLFRILRVALQQLFLRHDRPDEIFQPFGALDAEVKQRVGVRRMKFLVGTGPWAQSGIFGLQTQGKASRVIFSASHQREEYLQEYLHYLWSQDETCP